MRLRFPLSILLLGVVMVVAGCGPNPQATTPGSATTTVQKPDQGNNKIARNPAPATIQFTDVTKSAGIDFTYKNDNQKMNRAIVESLGGGQGMFDFDRDGLLDLFHVGGGFYRGPENKDMGGHPSVLYRNRGDWKFENISDPAGGFVGDRFKHGCTAADFDNDGFQDVLVCGYGGLQLWRNMGDGTFEEIHAAAQLLDELWSSSGAWGDFNKDGFLDLYVAHYVNWSFDNNPLCMSHDHKKEVCAPKTFKGLPDVFYFSNGDGTFREASKEAGLKPDGKGLAVMTGDFDLDGDQDIYVCNDTTENFLFLNDGTGKFEEDAGLRGCANDESGIPNGSMGVDLGDYDHDGLPDIWVANFEREAFAMYHNDAIGDQKGFFRHLSQPLGITAIGTLFVGFGTSFVDLDRDGYEDILVNNGHVVFHPVSAPDRQLPLVLMNEQGRSFTRVWFGEGSYLNQPHRGRGLALGDLDNDGDMDLGFTNNDEPSALLRNDSSDTNHWLRVRLIGRESNRDAIGARLELHAGGQKLLRFVKSGASYLSHCDDRPLWGIPHGATIESLIIYWPSGRKQTLESPKTGDMVILEPREGQEE